MGENRAPLKLNSMKVCVKCNKKVQDADLFCEHCGASEFTTEAEVAPSAESTAVPQSSAPTMGDANAIADSEIITGGKNNTTNTDNSVVDNSVTSETTNVTQSTTVNDSSTINNTGASASDMNDLVKMMMKESRETMMQMMQMQNDKEKNSNSSSNDDDSNNDSKDNSKGNSKNGERATKGDVKQKGEYELVIENYLRTINNSLNRANKIMVPSKTYYMRRYRYAIWITATIFCFMITAATAISLLWITVLGTLAMSIFSTINRFKQSEESAYVSEFELCKKQYLEIKEMLVPICGSDHSIFIDAEGHFKKIGDNIATTVSKAKNGAKTTTAIICVVIFAAAYIISSAII